MPLEVKEAESLYVKHGVPRYGWLRASPKLFTSFAEHLHDATFRKELFRLGELYKGAVEKHSTFKEDNKRRLGLLTAASKLASESSALEHLITGLAEVNAEAGKTAAARRSVEDDWFAEGESWDRRPPAEPRKTARAFSFGTISAKKLLELRRSPVVKISSKVASGIKTWKNRRQIAKNIIVHPENAVVSPRHAEMFVKDGALYLLDLHEKPVSGLLSAAIGVTGICQGRKPLSTVEVTHAGKTSFANVSNERWIGYVGGLYKLSVGNAFVVGFNHFIVDGFSSRKIVLKGIGGSVHRKIFTFKPREKEKLLIGRDPTCDLRLLSEAGGAPRKLR